jgi:hypothetical protein
LAHQKRHLGMRARYSRLIQPSRRHPEIGPSIFLHRIRRRLKQPGHSEQASRGQDETYCPT